MNCMSWEDSESGDFEVLVGKGERGGTYGGPAFHAENEGVGCHVARIG